MEQSIPSPPEVIETHTIDDRLGYITDNKARETVDELLKANNRQFRIEKAIQKIKEKGGEYTVRDAVTNKLCGVRTSKEAQDLFDQLHAEGYGEPETIGTTTVFTLHPEH